MAKASELCGIDDIYRDLVEAEGTAAPSSKAGLVKARADMLALFAYHAGETLLTRAGAGPASPPGGALGHAWQMVRRGVSAPLAARICGVDMTDEARDSLMGAEDVRRALIELSLFSRVIFDSSSGAVACLKTWTENKDQLTKTGGKREPTLLDFVADWPELADLVRQRYGEPLGATGDTA